MLNINTSFSKYVIDWDYFMADDIDSKLKKYMDSMQKQSDANIKSTEHIKNMARTAAKVDRSLDDMVSGFQKASSEASKLKGNLLKTSAWMGLLASGVGAAVEIIAESVDVYRDMNNVGQTFGGSMLNMQIAAAGAALPLRDFAELIQQGNNSMVAAAAGVSAFGGLGKHVRNNMKEFGMLGLTTRDFNEYLTEFSETQRLYGKASVLDTDNNRIALQKLTEETTMMSNLTGKHRKEILKDSQSAMRNASVQVAMAKLSQSASESLLNSLQSSTTYLAGLPGEAGRALSNMLTETVGLGTSAVSEQIQEFNSVGLSAVGGMMDDLARKVKNGTATLGDQEQFRKQFVDLIGSNLDSLQAQLLGPNKEAAKRAIQMFTEMKNIKEKTPEEISKAHDEKSSTDFLLSIQERMNAFGGWLRMKFFTSFKKVYDALQKAIASGAFKKLGDVVSQLFKFLSEKIEKYLDPKNLDNFAASLESGVKKLGRFSDNIETAAVGVMKIYDFWDTKLLNPLQKRLGDFGGLLAAIGTVIAAKWLGGKLLNTIFDTIAGEVTSKFKDAGAKQSSAGTAKQTGGTGDTPHTTPQPNSGSGGSGKSGKSGKLGKLGKLGKMSKVMKGGGLVGAGLTAASMLGLMPDGIDALSNIAGLASMGASIGSIIPGVGTVIGGVIGGAIGLAMNWKEAGKEISDMYDKTSKSLSDTYDKYLGPMVSSVKTWWKDLNFSTIADTIGNWFGSIKDNVATVAGNVWDKVKEFKNYSVNLAGTTLTGAVDLAKKGASAIGMNVGNTNVGQVVPQNNSSGNATPSVNVDALKKQLDEVSAKNQKLADENIKIREQLAKLVDLIAKNNVDNTSLLRDIAENGQKQVKTTKNLGTAY